MSPPLPKPLVTQHSKPRSAVPKQASSTLVGEIAYSRPATQPSVSTSRPAKRAETKELPPVFRGKAEEPIRAAEKQLHPPGSCRQLRSSELAWCMRPRLMRADEQLRTAYEKAARAGVERHVLAVTVRKWTRLRRRAIADPERVATGYRAMAEQLDAAREDQGAGEI